MTAAPDLEYFEQHYGINHPDLADHMWEVVEHMQSTCPVARSDAPANVGGAGRGMWVVTKYEDVLTVLQDWRTFSSDIERLVQADAAGIRQGSQPPLTVDPPAQRAYRQLLNPFLSPAALARHEDEIRRIVTELIDDFIEDGHCDLVSQLTKLEPPRLLYRVLFGIDEDELRDSVALVHAAIDAKEASAFAEANTRWNDWIGDFIDRRRSGPRRTDIIDALLTSAANGLPLTDDDIVGVFRVVTLGGFFTTNDAASSTMLMLIEHPELQAQLRHHPRLIPEVLDETLRLEAPVVSLFRVCTRDVQLRGQQLHEGDAVLVHFGGADRDPDEFDEPAKLRMDRPRNRHVAFGAGPHRCIGSHLARLNLRVMFEEILSRLHDVQITEGDAPPRATPGSVGDSTTCHSPFGRVPDCCPEQGER